jgi:hypothetical protein
MLTLFSQATSAQSTKTTCSSEKTSISTSDSDDDYSLTARFNDNKTQAVRQLVESYYPVSNGNSSAWSVGNYANISIGNGRIALFLDKEKASAAEVKRFMLLAQKISDAI